MLSHAVESVLRLGSPGVNILDPCTGTGNFIVNLLRRIPKRDLPRMYRQQLFANEVMLLPYYIAALNIEHAYFERAGTYEPFEGLCFVDTLDMAEGEQREFGFMTAENTQRVERQKKAPITVIIGNPPYNVGQINENDNNKNRKYDEIERRIKTTYANDSRATLNTKLYDPYVKFIRWATDRIGDDGIVCVVSNNSFVEQNAFDGMRKHLLRDYTQIFHVHLEGNVRENPTLSGTAYNVFGIQVGVGITIALKSTKHRSHRLHFERIDKRLPRAKKLAWLTDHSDLNEVKWKVLEPDDRSTWLTPTHADEFESFVVVGSKEAKSGQGVDSETVFRLYSLGVSTNRDNVVYDFNAAMLLSRVEQFCDDYNGEVDRYRRKGRNQRIDDFLDYSTIKWSSTLKAHVRRDRYVEFDARNARLTADFQ